MNNASINRRNTSCKIFLIVCLLAGSASFTRAHAAESDGVTVQNGGKSPPQLFFACDGSSSKLEALLTPELIADLKTLNAGVAISTEDFSQPRTGIVQRLNAAGIPVVAWLVLPPEQGYYSNADNAPETLARFMQFDAWTSENKLQWAAVGLDIEPNLSEFAALKDHKLRFLGLVLRRAFDAGRVQRAHDAYSAIIGQIQSRGYSVQTYQFPFIADARRAQSTVLERLLGLLDVRGNDEALMVYTSFNHKLGPAMIWEYGPDTQIIDVGITVSSGDAATDAAFPPLNWQEFSSDLIVARHFSPVIGVYNLQGCVQQGFIARLKTMNWNESVVISPEEIAGAVRVRRLVRAAFWTASHAIYLAVAIILFFVWMVYRLVRRRRRRQAAMLAGAA